MKKISYAQWAWLWVSCCVALFFIATLPLAYERPSGGRSAERQGYTAGIIRMYCLDPGHSILKGPQIHFGNNPFNLEYTGFEWLQGVAARAVGGPDCGDAVERIGKTVSVSFSTAAIALIAWAAFLFALRIGLAETSAWIAAAVAAFLLASCELWLRYATYTMVENRMLFFALLALCSSWKLSAASGRRGAWFLLAAASWAMTGMHKPQGCVFFSAFWLALEMILWLEKSKRSPLLQSARSATSFAFILGGAAVFGWLLWSHDLGVQSDLPWILHTGPRAAKWYFGNWSERFRLHFYASNLLKSLQQTGVLVVLPALLSSSLFLKLPLREPLRALARVFAPHLAATFVFVFLFWAVYIVHEYYALPLDVMRALCTATALAILCEHLFDSDTRRHRAVAFAAALILTGVCAKSYFSNVPRYLEYAARINDPRSPTYLHGWGKTVFPKKNPFAVMAVRSRGSELLHLYLAKAHGFIWCTQNPAHAPRKYWKEEGVEFVAWGEPASDPRKPGLYTWQVRTIDEELAIARERGWSSDVNDHWAGRTMNEWAALASRAGRDPCVDPRDYDPRNWE